MTACVTGPDVLQEGEGELFHALIVQWFFWSGQGGGRLIYFFILLLLFRAYDIMPADARRAAATIMPRLPPYSSTGASDLSTTLRYERFPLTPCQS